MQEKKRFISVPEPRIKGISQPSPNKHTYTDDHNSQNPCSPSTASHNFIPTTQPHVRTTIISTCIFHHETEASLLWPFSLVFAVLTDVAALGLRSNHGSGAGSNVSAAEGFEGLNFRSAIDFSMRSFRRVIARERTSM